MTRHDMTNHVGFKADLVSGKSLPPPLQDDPCSFDLSPALGLCIFLSPFGDTRIDRTGWWKALMFGVNQDSCDQRVGSLKDPSMATNMNLCIPSRARKCSQLKMFPLAIPSSHSILPRSASPSRQLAARRKFPWRSLAATHRLSTLRWPAHLRQFFFSYRPATFRKTAGTSRLSCWTYRLHTLVPDSPCKHSLQKPRIGR